MNAQLQTRTHFSESMHNDFFTVNGLQSSTGQTIFEGCNSVQTESIEIFEHCDSNQTKKGRGGARANSGMKSTGIETVTVRIDKRLLNTVTTIKQDFKDGKSLDDIISKPTAKNDDAKLLKKIAKLERDKDEMRDGFFKLLESDRQNHKAEIERLNEQNNDAELLKKIAVLNNKNQHLCDCLENEKQARIREVKGLRNMISSLNESIDLLIMNEASSKQTGGNLGDKLRKRLIQALHPDKFQDVKQKAVNGDLVKELNSL